MTPFFLESDESDSEADEEDWENGDPLLISPPPSLPKYDEVRFRPPLTSQYSLQPFPTPSPSTNGE